MPIVVTEKWLQKNGPGQNNARTSSTDLMIFLWIEPKIFPGQRPVLFIDGSKLVQSFLSCGFNRKHPQKIRCNGIGSMFSLPHA
jgi:hypothetical protein